MDKCKRLTIFEGPDGSGKSTAAQAYASETGAGYVHFGPLKHVKKNLGRVYVEAMLPALLGYQDVVFDRSWLSEVPYGIAFRRGEDRLGPVQRRMLERLAMRCSTVVVNCRPSWDQVCETYLGRRADEMLENAEQLRVVYAAYGDFLDTDLPQFKYDYSTDDASYLLNSQIWLRTVPHLIDITSAGNLDADVLLVGDKFSEPKEQDSLYQWPFASFSDVSSSRWFTQLLKSNDLKESRLLWINSDQDVGKFIDFHGGGPLRIFALGHEANSVLQSLGLKFTTVEHPDRHFARTFSEPYGLIDLLKEELL